MRFYTTVQTRTKPREPCSPTLRRCAVGCRMRCCSRCRPCQEQPRLCGGARRSGMRSGHSRSCASQSDHALLESSCSRPRQNCLAESPFGISTRPQQRLMENCSRSPKRSSMRIMKSGLTSRGFLTRPSVMPVSLVCIRSLALAAIAFWLCLLVHCICAFSFGDALA